jgi:hypothetical protein
MKLDARSTTTFDGWVRDRMVKVVDPSDSIQVMSVATALVDCSARCSARREGLVRSAAEI